LIATVAIVFLLKQTARRDQIRQRKSLSAKHVDVLEPERRQPNGILGPDLVTLGHKLVQRPRQHSADTPLG
jgi:hypothetical protein